MLSVNGWEPPAGCGKDILPRENQGDKDWDSWPVEAESGNQVVLLKTEM